MNESSKSNSELSNELKIEYVKIDDLKPWSDNPRTISDHDANALKNSIESFGIVEPIVINFENEVIGGHQRLIAIKELGGTEAPVIRVKLKGQKAKALNIALNRISGEWEYDLLKKALGDLPKEFQGLTGFDSGELDGLLKPEFADDIDLDLDDIPEVSRETDVKLGDIYQLGDHRLMCGDSTSKEDVEKLMDGKKADMVFTDPPYNVNLKHRGKRGHEIANYKDDYSEDDYSLFLKNITIVIKDNLKDGGVYYIFHNWASMHLLVLQIKTHKELLYHQMLIWHKQWPVMGRTDYIKDFELMLYGWKKGTKHIFNPGRARDTDVWQIRKDNPAEYIHIAQRPVEVPMRGIKNSSKRTDIILDLFGGSGSTLIACEQLNRHCYMMEIDPYYCDVIIKRWEKLTGNKAIRIN